MTRVIVYGALGRMGHITAELVKKAPDMELVGAADALSDGSEIPAKLDDITAEADVIIDFSHHSLTTEMLDWAIKHSTPVVLCTTAHDDAELAAIGDAYEKVAIFRSANMSVGIAVLIELAKKAAAALPEAEIEIVEAHHDRKLDAPSGTALMLAEAIKEVRPESVFNTGRSGHGKRTKEEIGIHALRMGNLPGTHEVHICTDTQSITLRHEVYDRALFAEGAIAAARFLAGKSAGHYDMKDLLA